MEANDNRQTAEALAEIKAQMAELIESARQLVRGTHEEDRARHYWYAQMRCALDDDHMFFGGGSVTLQDTIDALSADEEEDEEA